MNIRKKIEEIRFIEKAAQDAAKQTGLSRRHFDDIIGDLKREARAALKRSVRLAEEQQQLNHFCTVRPDGERTKEFWKATFPTREEAEDFCSSYFQRNSISGSDYDCTGKFLCDSIRFAHMKDDIYLVVVVSIRDV